MADRTLLLFKLQRIFHVASGNHVQRLIFRPVHYIVGLVLSKIIFPIVKKRWEVRTKTFFGANMNLALPAGLDLYILGAKGHHSECKLAMFLVKNLNTLDFTRAFVRYTVINAKNWTYDVKIWKIFRLQIQYCTSPLLFVLLIGNG